MADDEDVLGDPLSVEDDDYAVVHGPAQVAVVTTESLDEARDRARHLVEHGLGATVAEVTSPPGFEVRVLPEDSLRAVDLLGEASATDAAVAAAPASPPEEPAAPATSPQEREPVPWKMLLAIWAAALVILPVVAFLGTYLLTR